MDSILVVKTAGLKARVIANAQCIDDRKTQICKMDIFFLFGHLPVTAVSDLEPRRGKSWS